MFLDIIFCECGETLDAQALCTVPRGATVFPTICLQCKMFDFGADCRAGRAGST